MIKYLGQTALHLWKQRSYKNNNPDKILELKRYINQVKAIFT